MGPLFMLLALLLTVALGVPSFAAETGDLQELRRRALELVNQERRAQGLSTLEIGEDLNEAALSHARDMLRRDYYAHESPEGETVQDRYVSAGGSRWHLVAENIARCEGCSAPPTEEVVERLHRGWMHSPEHRHNILRQGLRRFGFGIVVAEGQPLYAVQTFAGPGTPRGLHAGEEPSPIKADEQQRRAVVVINRARRQAGVPPLEVSPALATAADVMLPDGIPDDFRLKAIPRDPYQALAAAERGRWASILTIAGACGGCGVEPTPADVRSFAEQWLEDRQYRETLLDRAFTHLGFRVAADGGGRKVAVAVLGAKR